MNAFVQGSGVETLRARHHFAFICAVSRTAPSHPSLIWEWNIRVLYGQAREEHAREAGRKGEENAHADPRVPRPTASGHAQGSGTIIDQHSVHCWKYKVSTFTANSFLPQCWKGACSMLSRDYHVNLFSRPVQDPCVVPPTQDEVTGELRNASCYSLPRQDLERLRTQSSKQCLFKGVFGGVFPPFVYLKVVREAPNPGVRV